MGFLHRGQPHGHVVDLEEFAVVGEALAPNAAQNDLQRLAVFGRAFVVIQVIVAELDGGDARPTPSSKRPPDN